MFTKNVSIVIKKGEKVPLKETYLVFYKNKDKIKLVTKFKDKTKNQCITLKYNECRRMTNLLNYYLFNGKYEPHKDKMVIFESES